MRKIRPVKNRRHSLSLHSVDCAKKNAVWTAKKVAGEIALQLDFHNDTERRVRQNSILDYGKRVPGVYRWDLVFMTEMKNEI